MHLEIRKGRLQLIPLGQMLCIKLKELRRIQGLWLCLRWQVGWTNKRGPVKQYNWGCGGSDTHISHIQCFCCGFFCFFFSLQTILNFVTKTECLFMPKKHKLFTQNSFLLLPTASIFQSGFIQKESNSCTLWLNFDASKWGKCSVCQKYVPDLN